MEVLENLFREKLIDGGWEVKGPVSIFEDSIQFVVSVEGVGLCDAYLNVRADDNPLVENELAWINGVCASNSYKEQLVIEPLPVLIRTCVAAGRLQGLEWVILSPNTTFKICDPEFGDELGWILLSLAQVPVNIMKLKFNPFLPNDMTNRPPHLRDEVTRNDFLRQLEKDIAYDEEGRMRGLLLMAAHVIALGVVRPAHGSYVMEHVHVSSQGADERVLYLVGGMDARAEEIVFWDVATMYYDIYVRWGQRAAHTYRNFVRGLLDEYLQDLFNQYFADVCAFHILCLCSAGDMPIKATYLDELLEL